MPPWVMPDTQAEECEAACERIADNSWHKCKGVNHDLHNCPVISKRFEHDLDGSFWFCEAFEAVRLELSIAMLLTLLSAAVCR